MSTVRFTRAMAAGGHHSTGICRPGSPIHQALLAAGLEPLPVAARDYLAPRAVGTLRQWIASTQPHILHAHRGTDLWLLRQAAWGQRCPPRLVWTSRILFKRLEKRDPLHRWLYRGVGRVVALSSLARDYLLRCLPLSPEQIIVIPNGVDLERFPLGEARRTERRRLRAQLGVAHDTPLLGVVGRLDWQKRQEDAIAALAQVRQSHPAARLLLIGAETAGERGEAERLRRLALAAGVGDRVDLLGHREDVPALLCALDLFLMPSLAENFGNVLLEAMAAGLPVIATESGGSPEILADGEAGWLVPPRDAPGLAAAIGELLGDRDRAARLAAAGRSRVQRCYAFPVVVRRTEELYRELLSATRHHRQG